MGDKATDYLYPTGGKTDVAEKDVEQVVVVDGVEGFADVEESGGERRVVFAGLVLLAQEEEEGLLVTIAVVTEARLAEVGLAYIGVSTDEGKEVEVNSFVEEADKDGEKGYGPKGGWIGRVKAVLGKKGSKSRLDKGGGTR